jgi:F-type H+-transporting ATPase subunit gamma
MREQTQRRRQAVKTIHDIVSAMRAIAAGRIQGAQRALEAARRYHAVVRRAIALLLAELEQTGGVDRRPTTLLVMTSEQPFCGSFNQEIIDLAERRWHELTSVAPAHLLVVGQRGMRQMIGRGLVPDAAEPAATSLDGIHDLVKRLAALLGQRHATGGLGTLRVIYGRYQSVSQQVPTEVQVLPLDLEEIRCTQPIETAQFHRHLSRPELLAGLVDEYAFITLYRLAAESYTSEQASRLVAMDASTRNTERILESLLSQERRERQDEITREVLELIGARFAVDA